MFQRLTVFAAVLSLALAGCAHPKKEKSDKPAEAAAAKKKKKKEDEEDSKIKDASGDTSFQAFVGHLRAAVAKHDRVEITAMLAPDFGYDFNRPGWNPGSGESGGSGETPFDYWDQHALWTELESVLSKHFQPKEQFMVSPPKFVEEDSYRGPRAGIRLYNGSWRLAYFVTGEDVLQ